MLCRQLAMVPVECVARGYLTGSGLAEYERTGTANGVRAAARAGRRLAADRPIFTPAMKAEVGEHDENVSFEEMAEPDRRPGAGRAAAGRDARRVLAGPARSPRSAGSSWRTPSSSSAGSRGGTLVLADEALTPDSSRFWPADEWKPGRAQPSFDKQYVRDWLSSPASGWDRASDAPPPALPEEVVEATRAARYVEAYERLTGVKFD